MTFGAIRHFRPLQVLQFEQKDSETKWMSLKKEKRNSVNW